MHTQVQNPPSQHWFWGVLLKYVSIYRDVAIASILINILTLASPLFVMNVYDRVVPNKAMETLWVLASGITLAYALDFFLRIVRSYFIDLAGRKADVILADKLMEKVLHIKLDAAPQSTGGFVNTVREFEQLREFFGSTSLVTCIDLPFTILFLILLGYLGGPMVLVPLIAVPCMLGFSVLLQIPFKRATEAQYKQNTQKNSLLVEIIGGLETIKANELHATMRQRWKEVVSESAITQAKARSLATSAAHSTLFVGASLNTIFVIWGVYRIADTSLSMGGLIACVILLGRVMQPLMQLSGLLGQFHKSKTALKALNELMSLPTENYSANTAAHLQPNPANPAAPATQPASEAAKVAMANSSLLDSDLPSSDMDNPNQTLDTKPTPPLDAFTLEQITLDSTLVEASYQLENIEFYYPDRQMAKSVQSAAGEIQVQQTKPLSALSIPELSIKAGERVGIIGQTGSGKSTLARLLVGLYSPSQGMVRLGHRDLASANVGILRQRIGFMPQDNYLFQGSLYENISMGAPLATPQTVREAARLAGLLPFIERHPQGFALPVGERGLALSGGQRQAIALARVLVRNPEIVILDEPTSNLDMNSEKSLLAHCKQSLSNKTLIVCTHRISVLTLINRVIVLHEGKIRADGPVVDVLQALSSTGV